MIHKMKLQKQPFENISNGTKTIEMRLYDEKRQQLKIGDMIEFSQYDDDSKTILTKIINIHIFKNFKELYENFDKKQLGYKESENAKPEDMTLYYSLQQQSQYGVVGIEIQLIK